MYSTCVQVFNVKKYVLFRICLKTLQDYVCLQQLQYTLLNGGQNIVET